MFSFITKCVGSLILANHLLQNYSNQSDDCTVHFDVEMSEENMLIAKQEGLLKKFKLTANISTSNMHLFDPKGVIKKYDSPEQSKQLMLF